MATSQDYSPPALCIYQDFQAVLAAGAAPLYPVIVGPAYALHRYSEEAEKASLGVYDRTQQVDYLWPASIAGGIVDLTTAKIMNEDALLNYYTAPTVSNLSADNSNRVVLTDIIATNDEGLRAAALGDRDVTAGDVIRIKSTGGSLLLESVVIGTEADQIPGTTDPSMERIVGAGTQTQGATETSTPPTAYTTGYTVTAYDGLSDGYPIDTYTVRVTALGTGGAGGLDDTQLVITSAGGDSNNVTLSTGNYVGPAYSVALGTRGALITIENSGVGSVAIEDSWQVVVSQNYTEIDESNAAEIKVTGPYAGSANTQYILTVLEGGDIGTDDVKIQFSTTNGQDTTGIIQATASSFTGPSADFAFGNRNMVLTLFNPSQMNTGDVLTFDVEAAKEGEIHTVIMRDSLAELAITDLNVDLFAKTTFEVSPLFYTLTQDQISVFGNMTQESDILGSSAVYDIYDGTLYADYREQRTIGTGSIGILGSATEISSALGPVDQLNPLACGVNEAFRMSNGVAVYYIAVASDDETGYLSALETLTRDNNVYSLVPLTDNETVKRAYAQHVLERSDNCNNQWRGLWIGNHTLPTKGVYGTDAEVTATVEDLPPGGARKVVSAGALFATNGVQAGDILRINFDYTDPANPSYEEYVIDNADEDFVTLLTALPAPITVAMKIEIWRNLSDYEYACEIGEYSTSYNSRRIKAIWADGYVTEDGEDKDLVYLCAYLAGARAGAAPHAPLSNVEHPGVLLDERYLLSGPNMNIAAAGGTWLVVKDTDGRVFTRHQLTTVSNADNLNEREDSVTTNLDHISREFKAGTQDLYGQGNVSPQMVALISARVSNINLQISSRPYSDILGPQLIDVENISVRVDATLQDTINVAMDPILPKPLNNLNIRFSVS